MNVDSLHQRRILGIDFGNRRIGISVSDPLHILARPIDALRNDGSFWQRLKELIARESIGMCVVGMPLSLKGQKGAKTKEVETFVDRLKKETELEVVLWDERFTTVMAQKTLQEMNVKKKARSARDGTVDSMAAAIILQGYLDSQKKSLIC